MGATLDMHERPFEVVIPWPDGGLAHFWRENDAPGVPWHGPAIFAAFQGSSVKNLEVIAVTDGGQVEHWWRENGGAFIWHKAATLFEDGI